MFLDNWFIMKRSLDAINFCFIKINEQSMHDIIRYLVNIYGSNKYTQSFNNNEMEILVCFFVRKEMPSKKTSKKSSRKSSVSTLN